MFRTSDSLQSERERERERGKEGKKEGKGSAKTAIDGGEVSMSKLVGLLVLHLCMD